jgi:peptidoglycan/xylan/chitin deacetylase (PgdA/CDA1 family)
MIRLQQIPILLYHRILEPDDPSFDLYSVSIDHFRNQMKALYHRGYRTVSLEDVFRKRDPMRPLPSKPIIIAFDDGYKDNYTHVLPILRSIHFSATIFLVVDFIEQKEKIIQNVYLSWDEIKEMQDFGFEFQSHGISHRQMDSLSEEEVGYELIFSKKILEQRLNRPVLFFSYPFCQYNEKIKELTRKAGYQGAMGGLPDICGAPQDSFEIGRSEILESDSLFMFMFKVRTGYNFYFFSLIIKTVLAKIMRFF